MFSKSKKSPRIDAEQREQYEYARKRINQKKNLMRHFILFLVGSVLLIIINPILGYGDETFIKNWFIWAILIWTFIFLVHLFNVFVINKFMGREWEDQQLEKLKIRQAEKMAELQRKVDIELPVEPETQLQEENIDPIHKQIPPETL